MTQGCDWSSVDCDGSLQHVGGKPAKDPTIDENGKVCRSTIDETTATCHDASVSSDEVANEQTAKDRAAAAYSDCVESYEGDDANYCRDATVRKYARERKGDPAPACDPINSSCEAEEGRAAAKACMGEAKKSYDQCMEDGDLMADVNCADGTLPDGTVDAGASRTACRDSWRSGIPGRNASRGTEEQNSTSLEAGPAVGKLGVGKSVAESRSYGEERGETRGYAKECADRLFAAQTQCMRP